jgi:hypothetical protein
MGCDRRIVDHKIRASSIALSSDRTCHDQCQLVRSSDGEVSLGTAVFVMAENRLPRLRSHRDGPSKSTCLPPARICQLAIVIDLDAGGKFDRKQRRIYRAIEFD